MQFALYVVPFGFIYKYIRLALYYEKKNRSFFKNIYLVMVNEQASFKILLLLYFKPIEIIKKKNLLSLTNN
jgi:hypothetical protein